MNNIDKQYQALLNDILANGVKKEDRTGTGTISVFGRQIRHKMSEGFPVLTTKRLYFKGIVTELLWFLRGDTNIKYLVENDCHVWDGDCYQAYLKEYKKWRETDENGTPLSKEQFINKIKTDDEFNKQYGDLGPIYGKQWRNWGEWSTIDEPKRIIKPGIDQIQNLINDLKTNPDSRRLMVSAWNVGKLDQCVLPPCHYGFQIYTRELKLTERLQQVEKIGLLEEFEKELSYSLETNTDHEIKGFRKNFCDKHNIPKRAISLMFNMRSNDVPLGLPFNIASYGLLLEIFGRMVNMVPDELIANLGDAHIYKNQIDGVNEQLTRTPMKLPNLIISNEVNFNSTINEFLESCNKDSFKLDGYESHPSIKIPLSN